MPIGCINAIIQNRVEIKEKFLKATEKDKIKQKIHNNKKTEKIFDLLFDWFSKQRELNMTVTNEILKEKALTIADDLGVKNFKVSYT